MFVCLSAFFESADARDLGLMTLFVFHQRDWRLRHAKPCIFSHILHVHMPLKLKNVLCHQLRTHWMQFKMKKKHEKNHIVYWFKPHNNCFKSHKKVVILLITERLAEAPEKSRTFWIQLSEFLICSKKPHQNRMMRTAAHCVHVLTLPIEFRGWRGGEFKLRVQTISTFQFMEFALIYFLWNQYMSFSSKSTI